MSTLHTFDYAHDGVALKGQLALPAGAGPHPAILVMHDARGLGDQPRNSARKLTQMGYAALAADMFGDGAYFPNPRAHGGEVVTRVMMNPALVRSRIIASFDSLKALPQVDSERIGTIGYCFGGHCVLELARSGADARAVVSFHGTLKTIAPAKPGYVKAKMLVLTGARDPYAPPEDVEALHKEMAAAGADCHVTSYSQAMHAFTDPTAETMIGVPGLKYDPLIDKLSWAQATAFLEALLKDA